MMVGVWQKLVNVKTRLYTPKRKSMHCPNKDEHLNSYGGINGFLNGDLKSLLIYITEEYQHVQL